MMLGKKIKNDAVRKKKEKEEGERKRGRVIFLLIYGTLVSPFLFFPKSSVFLFFPTASFPLNGS